MTDEKKQFIYVLKLIPSLLIAENWTEKEEQIVASHFERLQALLKEEKLILAGKTSGLNENTFGIVILEVESEDEAYAFMKNDPAVAAGIMEAQLFPYNVALMK